MEQKEKLKITDVIKGVVSIAFLAAVIYVIYIMFKEVVLPFFPFLRDMYVEVIKPIFGIIPNELWSVFFGFLVIFSFWKIIRNR